ncbi:hypothetical protein ACR743_15505, partial [Enterococcus gallinarum]
TASTTIKGMEAIRGLYKKTRKEGTLFGFSVCTEIKVLLGIPALIIDTVRDFILYLKLCNRTLGLTAIMTPKNLSYLIIN